jgi:RND superfamily putative drug exporter
LYRLGRASFVHHWRVLGAWIAALVVIGALAGAIGSGYTSDFGDFKSEAASGFDLLEAGFGGSSGGDEGQIVFVARDGVDDTNVKGAITDFLDKVDAIDGLDVASPYAAGGDSQIAREGNLAGQVAYATVTFPPDADLAEATDLADEAKALAPHISGVQIEFGGEVFADFEPPESELIGVGFAIVILILAFGSVLAMGLPIGMALAGIGAGVGVGGLLSQLMVMPEFTSTLAVMIGLGVGIDYALFIVSRYREDVHRGLEPARAAGHALDTAGRAVLFAGSTVIISLLGMVVMGIGFIRGLAVGAAIAVLFTLVASITLLPALLGFVGARIERTRWRGIVAAGLIAIALVGVGLKVSAFALAFPLAIVVLLVGRFVPFLRKSLPTRHARPSTETGWYRWSRLIQRRPWAAAIAGFVVLAVLAVPVFGMRLAFSDTGNYPEDTTTRKAYDLLADGFGPGFNGPLMLVTKVQPGTPPAVLDAVTDAVSATPGIAATTAAQTNPAGDVVRWLVVPSTSPEAKETTDLIHTLRDDVLPPVTDGTGIDVLVTGNTAIGVDFSDFFARRYPLFFGVVLGLSFVLLMAVFRSLLVPLKAVLVNLLSIGASYGVVVAIFQWGWGLEVFGLGKGAPIEPFMPMMLFAIVFGLSMDYEVFLLSRIKEEYDRTRNNARAVADGLTATARVITAAAAIMVVVFGSFVLEANRGIKLFGVGLAVAVLLDATIVRMLLVPATMELLGDRNWWLPRWIGRVLPQIHVEGRAEEPGAAREDDLEPELVSPH